MSAREAVEQEPEFVAFVGIDWADQKHVWCLQAAGSTQRVVSRRRVIVLLYER